MSTDMGSSYIVTTVSGATTVMRYLYKVRNMNAQYKSSVNPSICVISETT
jgi:hypothetical protein